MRAGRRAVFACDRNYPVRVDHLRIFALRTGNESDASADDSRWVSFDFDYFESLFVISSIASALGTEIDLDVIDTSGSRPY